MEKKNIKRKIYFWVLNIALKCIRAIFPEYSAKEPLTPTDRYIECPFVINNLPKPPARVLDVGCSGSFFPLLLASFGYDTYGIDVRNYPILNKLKFKNFTFINEDIRNTSFPDGYFDGITVISTLEHIGISGRYGMDEDFKGDIKAIKEMKRILKTNGVINITIPYGRYKIIKPYMKVYDELRVKELIQDFKVEKEEYYLLDDLDSWIRCSKEDAFLVDVKPDRYPLVLLSLRKN